MSRPAYRRFVERYRETSWAAWESVRDLLPAVDARIVDAIRAQAGATADEIECVTGLSHQTVSAQIRHLAEAGILTASSERRPTRSGRAAIVWMLATREARPDMARLF